MASADSQLLSSNRLATRGPRRWLGRRDYRTVKRLGAQIGMTELRPPLHRIVVGSVVGNHREIANVVVRLGVTIVTWTVGIGVDYESPGSIWERTGSRLPAAVGGGIVGSSGPGLVAGWVS